MEAGKLNSFRCYARDVAPVKNPPLELIHSSETSVAQLPGERLPSDEILLIPQRDFNLYLMGMFLYYFKSLILKWPARVPSHLAVVLGLGPNTLFSVSTEPPTVL